MAVVNVGKVGFEFKGAYNAGTDYVVNDVVKYNNSSYICIQNSTGNLPTNDTYWDLMSRDANLAGIGGLTAGDIVYWNGAAWTRLAQGPEGQAIKVNSAGTAPEYGPPGGYFRTYYYTNSSRIVCNTNADNKQTFTNSWTPTDPANNDFIFHVSQPVYNAGQDYSGGGIRIQNGSNTYDFQGKGHLRGDTSPTYEGAEGFHFRIPAGTIAPGTYNIYYRNYTSNSNPDEINPNNASGKYGSNRFNQGPNNGTESTLIIQEVSA